jgi:predicted nucleic acid-binding protein
MVIRRQDNPFFKKLYRYMKQFGYDTECKKFFKCFKKYFYDSNVTVLIDDTDVKDVPDEVLNKVKPDDRYLIELAYFSLDKTIITTDGDLKKDLQGISELKVILLDDFLKEYVTP